MSSHASPFARDACDESIPFGFAVFAFGSSFFFFDFGALSGSPSAFLFFPPVSVFFPAAFLVVFPADFSTPSSSLSSSPRPSPSSSFLRASSSRAASRARSLASLASFFRCAFSFFTLRHAAMCSLAAVRSMLFFAVFALLHVRAVFERSTGRKCFARRIVKGIDNGSRRCGGDGSGCLCLLLLCCFLCYEIS